MADAWTQPYQQKFFDNAQRIGQSEYTPYGQSTQVGANPMQQQSWQNTFNRGLQGAPEVSAARTQMTDTINGGGFQSNPFLSGENPYLQSTIDSTLGDITRNYNLTTAPAMSTAQARSGSFGNSGLQQIQGEQQRNLAQELGRASSNLRYGDYQNRSQLYDNERNRQMTATQNAPNFANVDYTDLQAMQQGGNAMQGQQQAERTADFNQYLDARQWPFSTQSAWGSAMGAGGGTVPQYPEANKGANALGGALAGWQIGSGINDDSGGNYGTWGAIGGGLLGLLS
jgi:hypothetical protein